MLSAGRLAIVGPGRGVDAAECGAPEGGGGGIATIGVLPEYRGRGIGGVLLQACEGRLKMPRVRLNVRVSNLSAIHLYQRMGYRQVSIWPRYYQDGEDALILEKSL